MLIYEFRVILPLTVEEYQVAQLYAVAKASKEQTGGGDGVENEYFQERFGIKIETFHSADIRLENAHKLPQELLDKRKVVYVDISEPTAPGDTKPGEDPTQYVSVKTNRGPLQKGRWWEKEHNCPIMCAYKLVTCDFKVWGFQTRIEDLIQRQEWQNAGFLIRRAIGYDFPPPKSIAKKVSLRTSAQVTGCPTNLIKINEKAKWSNSSSLVICIIHRNDGEVARTRAFAGSAVIGDQEQRLFTILHRELFCWTDEWYGMTMDDIRKVEDVTKEELEKQRRSSQLRGLALNDS
ncbi:hypothetical protein ACTXT7_011742 [Hymenolepis weldensis]